MPRTRPDLRALKEALYRSGSMPDDRLNLGLWRGALILMAAPLIGGLALILALALGWNRPGPTQPPDWQPPGLPIRLDAQSDRATSKMLGWESSDFTLEAQVRLLSSSDLDGYGLAYRAQDTTHYYVFAVGSDGYYAVLRVRGSEEIALADWQQFPHIHRAGEANRLRVSCTGPMCHFYVNDEFATSIKDDVWLNGDVGLWVRSFGDEEVAAQFLEASTWRAR